MLSKYSLTSGIEVHCQLQTETKLFSNAPTPRLTDASNNCANFVDLAFPGMLPVFNSEWLKLAIKASLALRGNIDKKNGYGNGQLVI